MAGAAPLVPEGHLWRAFAVTTFVSVGNARQPFSRLLAGVAAAAARMPAPVIVQHGHTPFLFEGLTGRAFMPMDAFAALLGQSDLVILHAGAGSILQAIDAGKCPVVMPRRSAEGEHIDDHQCELARAFAKRGLVELAMEVRDLEPAIERALAREAQTSRKHDDRLSRLLAEDLQSCARGRETGGRKLFSRS